MFAGYNSLPSIPASCSQWFLLLYWRSESRSRSCQSEDLNPQFCGSAGFPASLKFCKATRLGLSFGWLVTVVFVLFFSLLWEKTSLRDASVAHSCKSCTVAKIDYLYLRVTLLMPNTCDRYCVFNFISQATNLEANPLNIFSNNFSKAPFKRHMIKSIYGYYWASQSLQQCFLLILWFFLRIM